MSRPKGLRRRHRRQLKRALIFGLLLLAVIGSVLIAFSMASLSGGDGGASGDVDAAP